MDFQSISKCVNKPLPYRVSQAHRVYCYHDSRTKIDSGVR